jgi:hypothetical protein
MSANSARSLLRSRLAGSRESLGLGEEAVAAPSPRRLVPPPAARALAAGRSNRRVASGAGLRA